jgi:protein-tyrosine phosphatase
MAEAILRHYVLEANLADKMIVDSAGTANWHRGKMPHEGTRKKLDEYHISYEGMTARQVEEKDYAAYDYIITMDESNLDSLAEMFPNKEGKAKVCRLMDFVADPKEKNVPDPYYTGDFDYTYTLVSEACSAFLTFLKEKHHIYNR